MSLMWSEPRVVSLGLHNEHFSICRPIGQVAPLGSLHCERVVSYAIVHADALLLLLLLLLKSEQPWRRVARFLRCRWRGRREAPQPVRWRHRPDRS